MCVQTDAESRSEPLIIARRYCDLTVWVALCIVVGIALGHWLPASFQALGELEVARVNLPVMLSVVHITTATKDWYERGAARRPAQDLQRRS